MIIRSRQIKGQGKGMGIGFPTINLAIPDDLVLDTGIYASWVDIGGKTYKGAVHYGPIPTFGVDSDTLEIHLLEVEDSVFPDTTDIDIEVDIVSRLRDVKKFISVDAMVEQITRDVKQVRSLLKL